MGGSTIMLLVIVIGCLLLIGVLAGTLYMLCGSTAGAEESHNDEESHNEELVTDSNQQQGLAVEMNPLSRDDTTSVKIASDASLTDEHTKQPDQQKEPFKILAGSASMLFLVKDMLGAVWKRSRSLKIMIG